MGVEHGDPLEMKVLLIVFSVLLPSFILSSPVEAVEGLRTGRMIRGNSCEYIRLNSIPNNLGCVNGTKFVIKRADELNSRKQFIILDGEVLLVFVGRGEKFSQCSSYRDITAERI